MMTALLLAAMLTAAAQGSQEPPASPAAASASSPADAASTLPVSLDRIKRALEQPPVQTLRGLTDVPTFKVEITEKQRVRLEDLINSLDFKSGPVPAGGLYAYEQQRQMWPAVNNPLTQPYAAFSPSELVTILVENLVGRYLVGKAAGAITSAERSSAEAAAREEVVRAITDYCAAQPRAGAGIQICANPSAVR
jgi:hypothetical protein